MIQKNKLINIYIGSIGILLLTCCTNNTSVLSDIGMDHKHKCIGITKEIKLEELEDIIVDELFATANLIIFIENLYNEIKYEITYPILPGQKKIGKLSREELINEINGISNDKSIALVIMQIKLNDWPISILDDVENILAKNEFVKVVIVQSTSQSVGYILRWTRNPKKTGVDGG